MAAVELASTFGRFGVRVVVLTPEARLLPAFDATVSEAATRALAGCGVEVIVNADVVHVEYDAVNGGIDKANVFFYPRFGVFW